MGWTVSLCVSTPLTRNYPQRKIKSYPPVPQNETFRGEQADTLVEETDNKQMHNVRSDKCTEKELNSIRGHDRHLLGWQQRFVWDVFCIGHFLTEEVTFVQKTEWYERKRHADTWGHSRQKRKLKDCYSGGKIEVFEKHQEIWPEQSEQGRE